MTCPDCRGTIGYIFYPDYTVKVDVRYCPTCKGTGETGGEDE